MSAAVEPFITRWQAAGGSERANYQLFLGELAELLELPRPDPASDDTRDNAYVFERRVHFRHGDGTESVGYIDLYKRGAFVLEAKKLRQTAVKGFDEALLRARSQAEGYARALPADEGRPGVPTAVADSANGKTLQPLPATDRRNIPAKVVGNRLPGIQAICRSGAPFGHTRA